MKKIKRIIKMQIPAGKATPAPPVGSTLGQHGLNIQEFCVKFNAATKNMGDMIVPTKIIVFEDRTYDLVIKTALTSELLKKAAGIAKGSKTAKEKSGQITEAQLREIATAKQKDLNSNSIEAAMEVIKGTAKSMGIDVK